MASDLAGHLADAIRDTMRIYGGTLVSFDASEKMASAALQYLRDRTAPKGGQTDGE